MPARCDDERAIGMRRPQRPRDGVLRPPRPQPERREPHAPVGDAVERLGLEGFEALESLRYVSQRVVNRAPARRFARDDLAQRLLVPEQPDVHARVDEAADDPASGHEQHGDERDRSVGRFRAEARVEENRGGAHDPENHVYVKPVAHRPERRGSGHALAQRVEEQREHAGEAHDPQLVARPFPRREIEVVGVGDSEDDGERGQQRHEPERDGAIGRGGEPRGSRRGLHDGGGGQGVSSISRFEVRRQLYVARLLREHDGGLSMLVARRDPRAARDEQLGRRAMSVRRSDVKRRESQPVPGVGVGAGREDRVADRVPALLDREHDRRSSRRRARVHPASGVEQPAHHGLVGHRARAGVDGRVVGASNARRRAPA